MKGELFRKEAVERITGPEDMNTYIKVLNPKVWLVLAGIAIAIAGMLFFAVNTGFPIRELLFGGTIDG